MAMNKFMHPRNPYKKPPDFLQLTLEYPDLRKFVKPDLSGKVKINFKREGAVRELTKCLLHKDFGLSLDLPPDRLVPTLPLRMNYLLWIEDLLNESGKEFYGVDIGTGASCIYPLLAVKYFNWKMRATEIDQESVSYAVKNVENNDLKEYITVVRVEDNVMLDGALDDNVIYDFCMCNPPFYCDEAEMSGKARTDRRAPPRNHPSGLDFELIAPGGETSFISRIVDDSAKLRCKIRVYTVMVGHKSNLNKVKDFVRKVNPVKMKVTEFCQGRTTRWGLAWTFSTDSNLLCTAVQPRKDQNKPPYRWIYPVRDELSSVVKRIRFLLNELQISISTIESDEGSCGLCLKAYENTWSHSRRKRREEKRKLVETVAVSPCDSVVTGNESIASNGPNSPLSSPADSLGYSSCNEIEDVSSITTKASSLTTKDTTKTEICLANSSTNSTLHQENISKEDASAPDIQKKYISSGFNYLQNTSVSDSSGRKRPLESSSSSPDSKRVKREERPYLEAVLGISEFDGDIVFSLSFVDGTGGRESANQVFQYLKNKLSPNQ